MSIQDNKIKILHVVGRMDRGGTETLIMSLIRILDTDRFQYDIVEQTNDKCDYDDEIISLGCKIYRCPNIKDTSLKSYSRWWRQFYRDHPEYRIIHGHSRGSAPAYLKEAKKANRITIAHCHNNSYGKGMKGFIRRIWQLPLRSIADYNFACSEDSGISQYGKKGKFTVIKNGIRTEKFAWNPVSRERVRKEFHIEDSFVVGNVARFEEQKNHLFLIRIFAELKKIRENAKLMLVGSGSLENDIRTEAEKCGVLEDIIFTGLRSDVNDLYQAMDVFVLPSLFEGLGIVNIEAQASGLPCLVSDTVASEAGVTDLLTYLPLSETPEFWAEQILSNPLAENNRQDMSNAVASAGFDIANTLKELNDLYLQMLTEQK